MWRNLKLDGEQNGQGTTTYPDGGKYVGEFKDGEKKDWEEDESMFHLVS